MLQDLIIDLLVADNDPKEKEKCYKRLEKVGVDRLTADVMAAVFYEEDMQNA